MAGAPLRSAAQYVRMSTEHQRYSIEGQTLTNAAYAAANGLRIDRTYRDAGISGLSMKGRDGLKALLSDVVSGAAGFEVILVYDVSRWGRFQDPDQAAHYEFICREAGVAVEYTAEPFENDGGLVSGIVKHLKRAMAAEYSRELSVKVSNAKRGLSAQGYWPGSPPVYGFQRCELAADGSPGRRLAAGERKAIQGRRTVLVLGPAEEVETVRQVFRQFVIEGMAVREIVRRLNARGSRIRGREWTRNDIHRMLADEKYAGTLVFGRSASNLRVGRRQPRERWIRVEGGCPAIVRRSLYDLAQLNRRSGWWRPQDEVLLDELRALLARHGRLSHTVIESDPDSHCTATFRKRFGGLMAAYRRIGYVPSAKAHAAYYARMRQVQPRFSWPRLELSRTELLERLAALLRAHGRITCALIDQAPDLPSAATCQDRLGGQAEIYRLLGYSPSPRQLRAMRTGQGERARAADATEATRKSLPDDVPDQADTAPSRIPRGPAGSPEGAA